MRLSSFKRAGRSSIGAVSGEFVLDLNEAFNNHLGGAYQGCDESFNLDMMGFLELGEDGLKEAGKALHSSRESSGPPLYRLDSVRILAPIPRPRKNIVCLGFNYAEHLREGSEDEKDRSEELPKHPIFFTKPPTSVIGPDEPIIYPRSTEELDYEVELAFVIGKRGKYIPRERVYEYIAGYCVFNDITARDLQRWHGQWYRGKSCDTFAPMGPHIVTPDEIGDPQDLDIWLKVNGEFRQKASTRDMIFDIREIVSNLSAGITLDVGDIFATGTPSGVGMAHPKGLLRVGDLVEAGIEKIGTVKNLVVSE
jgi:2-keto-4-pentenoate hydratase/2-oxohepta-3-ene-1,7-dioic acid hydratase in catechol pathway